MSGKPIFLTMRDEGMPDQCWHIITIHKTPRSAYLSFLKQVREEDRISWGVTRRIRTIVLPQNDDQQDVFREDGLYHISEYLEEFQILDGAEILEDAEGSLLLHPH